MVYFTLGVNHFPTPDFLILCIGHLESTDSSSYTYLPNVNIFYFIKITFLKVVTDLQIGLPVFSFTIVLPNFLKF